MISPAMAPSMAESSRAALIHLLIPRPDLTMKKSGCPGERSTKTELASAGGGIVMRNGQGGWTRKTLAAMMATLAMVGVVAAQAQPRPNRGRVRNQGGQPLKKARPEAGDPLAKAAGGEAKAKGRAAAGAQGPGTYHYTFKLHSFDGTPLAASYYPSKLGSNAPVVMLIHEAGRSRRDFEEPVADLKGHGLAEHLQDEGYAVFSMDLRGQGQNPRRVLTASDRPLMAEDIQAAYVFLLDRHNRSDLNVAKLGVIALGEGANLAVAWAYQPGAAVSTEGRASDLNALVLISPFPQGSGYVLGHVLASLAPRVPLALLAGDKDSASKDAVQSVRPLVERARLNRVELFPSSPLHGYKLMRLEPKVTPALIRFLETTIKLRPAEWEPRYNLAPVTVSEITTKSHTTAPEKPAEKKGQAKAGEEPKAKPEAAPKPGGAEKVKQSE
jgi:pimeloyl-ACP methyl ester carboxylesterase